MSEFEVFLEIYGNEATAEWCYGVWIVHVGKKSRAHAETLAGKCSRADAWARALKLVVQRCCLIWPASAFAVVVPSADIRQGAERIPEVMAALKAHTLGDVVHWPHGIRPRQRLDEALSIARAHFEGGAKVLPMKTAGGVQ